MTEQAINFNYAQCIKATSNFSETIYRNICNGTSWAVPNGFWDYTLGFMVFTGGMAVILVIAGIAFNIITDW